MTLEQLKSMSVPQRFAAFVDWLGSQPAETPYNYINNHTCALCQFGKSIGMNGITSSDIHITYDNWTAEIEIMPSGKTNGIVQMGTAEWQLINAKTLGELHDRLLPFVVASVESAALTDAQMDALESRPLIPFAKHNV